MSKTITSKKGNDISFLVNGSTPLHIGTRPIVVSDEDAKVLVDRLGTQILVQDSGGVVAGSASFGKIFDALPSKK